MKPASTGQDAASTGKGAGADRAARVCEDGDLKKYRTETPNLVYELRLTPFELSLYCYLKRVAGAGADGRCFRATERIAEETGMSEGMVSKAKKGLLRADRPGLNGKALIRVEKDDARPGRPRDLITIVDIWPENFLFFTKQSSPQSSPGEQQSSPQSSPGEAKNKTPIPKKEVDEESTPRTLNVGAGQGETVDAPPAEQAPTPNASRPDFEKLPSEDEPEPKDAPPAATSASGSPRPGPGPINPGPINPGPINPGPINPGQPDFSQTARTLKAAEVDRVVRLTGDESSRRRFEQLYDLAEGAGLLLCWDQARKATHKAIQSGTLTGPPGAYFNATASRLLNEERPALVPTGTRAERRAVAAQARSSLAAAATGGGGGDTG